MVSQWLKQSLSSVSRIQELSRILCYSLYTKGCFITLIQSSYQHLANVCELHNVCGVECYPISKDFQVGLTITPYMLQKYGHASVLTLACSHSRAYCHPRGALGYCWRRAGAWRGTASFVSLLCWYCPSLHSKWINKPHPLILTGCDRMLAHAHWIALSSLNVHSASGLCHKEKESQSGD